MATTKVSDLSALTTTDGAEELLINDGGTSKKVTIANLLVDDQVTYAKIQNVSADERILGRVSGADGVIEELTKSNVLTMLNVEDGATADQSSADILTAIEDGIDSVHYKDGSIDNEHLADNAVGLAEMAGGTDGNIISYDASGDPVAIATGNDGQVLTSAGAGAPPAFEDAGGGAITKVTTAYQSDTRSAFSDSRDLFANNLGFVGHKVGFAFTKDSADTDILVHFSMSVTNFNDCYSTAIYTGTNGAASGLVRWAFAGRDAIGDTDAETGMIVSGHAVITGLAAAGYQYYWSMGRLNDAYNSQYTLNPDTNDDSQYGGATTSTIMVYEGDFD